MCILRAAIQQTALGAGEVQLLLCTRHRNIAQPPFFLHVLLALGCAEAGEKPVLHTRKEHHGELQPLGRVHGHHQHRVLVLGGLVCIGVERHILKEAAQRGHLVLFLIVDDVGLQFFDMLDATLFLGTALFHQRAQVAGLVQQLVVQLGQGEKLALLAQVLHHRAELLHRGGAAPERRKLRGIPHHVIEQHAVFERNLRGSLNRFVTNLAGRHIDDAPQAQLIRRVFQHPQIGKHISHLGA